MTWTAAEEGDAALLLTPPSGGAAGRAAVLALHRALEDGPPSGVLDWIHAPDSLLVEVDPLVGPAVVAPAILALAATATARPASTPADVLLPARFDGPDLADAAALAGTTAEALVGTLTAQPLTVAALGSNALPILVGDGARPSVPRLLSPRARVAAGSIGLAGDRVCVYPVAMPGGWRIVGRTAVPLLDTGRDPIGLLRPGDRVRFTACA